MKIGFIGLGNMARAIIGGMLREGIAAKEDILGSAKTQKTLDAVREEYGIGVEASNRQVAAAADVLILAVKPQFLEDVIGEIRDAVKDGALVISIAAGKTLSWLAQTFDRPLGLVRCMPNTPALVGEGCTGLCADDIVTKEELAYSLRLMGSFGKAILVEERLMDAVGAVSGSSPAYVFLFIEAMADAAVAAGMPRGQAYEFAAQAVYGSAKLVLETGKHPGELKDMVCSPGGTTIEGVKVLEEAGFRGAVMDALLAAVEKSRRL
ncbi:MAG: pyrroline-5-carboxylate reductase [Bacteroidales bacterium]|nr:pyrroline-5-carboxylate reductase [Bacteroidales bacterium]MCM1415034.1 pyrroline-5-carboxylate reductase [bacterium]MCM1422888.1 pyrroline-5-carboxylate reductase [bacterium]